MRHLILIFILLIGMMLTHESFAQNYAPEDAPRYSWDEESNIVPRYPQFGQGDTTPGSPVLPRGLELTVAAGVAREAAYVGSKSYEGIFKPAINAEYKQQVFFIHDRQSMMTPYEGIGYKLIGNPLFSLGVNGVYDNGRDNKGLASNLDSIDWTEFAGVFAAFHPGTFFVRGQYGVDVTGEYDHATKGEIGAGFAGPISPRWRGMIDLTGVFVGDDYNKNYYGITTVQSLASGLPVYDAKGGLDRLALGGTLQLNLGGGAFLQGLTRYNILTGDAKSSPLTEKNSQFQLQAMLGYHF